MDGRATTGDGSPITYRNILAKRVMSVEEYCQELRETKGRSPREIPVPLWPGESLPQYERRFVRWLVAGRVSLTAIRDDPVIERNCRLKFAETRVRRTTSNSPRATSRSRSRSPPPVRKHFEERSYIENRGDAMELCARRPSSDNGARQQPLNGPGHDRSYSRGYSQTTRYATKHEASRLYDDHQASHSADRQHFQGSRAPSPRGVYRQQVRDTQHQYYSRSRSPQYRSRAASSPQSDRSFSYVHRSASPRDNVRSDVESLRRQLLAIRVISVETFRDEIDKLQKGIIRDDDLKRPHETMVRIPIALWPGETVTQYSQKFERWLDSHNIPLALLCENPAKERSLWHSYAYTRAEMSKSDEVEKRPRSRSRSSSQSTQRSSERGRPPLTYHDNKLVKSPNAVSRYHPSRREYTCFPNQLRDSRSTSKGTQHPSSMMNPPEASRSLSYARRYELLERRIVSLEAFRDEAEQGHDGQEVDISEGSRLSPIPVPLHPRESMGLYDHRFWTWLKSHGESKRSLRPYPAKERKFRIAFAYLRIDRPQVLETIGDFSIETQNTEAPRSNVETRSKISVGALKPAHTQLTMDSRRAVEDLEQQAQAVHDKPRSKRARIVSEGARSDLEGARVIPDSTIHRSTVYLERKKQPALSSTSPSNELSRPSVAPIVVPSTGDSPSAKPSRLSILPQTAPEKGANVDEAQAAHAVTAPIQRKQINVPSERSTISAKVAMPPSLPASVQDTKTIPTTSPDLAKTSTKATASHVRESTTSVQTAHLKQRVVSSSMDKPGKMTTSSQDKTATWKKLIISKSLMLNKKPRTLAQATKPCMPTSSIPSTGPESLAESTQTARNVPIRASLSADVSRAKTPTTKTDPNVNVIENDSTDTDTADSAPDTAQMECAAQEMLNSEIDPAGKTGQHDGDVMNRDGCCCTKCMRRWAKMLTDRMDRLEDNVVSLKRYWPS